MFVVTTMAQSTHSLLGRYTQHECAFRSVALPAVTHTHIQLNGQPKDVGQVQMAAFNESDVNDALHTMLHDSICATAENQC